MNESESKDTAQVNDWSLTEELYSSVIGKANTDEVTFSRTLTHEKERNKLFQGQGALHPPYPPFALCRLFEVSNALRQNVEAYETNIDGAGHRFVPTFDFSAPDALNKLRELFLADGKELSDEELERELETRSREAVIEKQKLKNFFDFCSTEESFVALRRKTRRDNEIIGHGAWEVLRSLNGEIAQFVHMPSCFLRLMPQDEDFVTVEIKVKKNPIEYRSITVHKKFRRFVQMDESSNFVFFKEFGDPRTMSAFTGKFYDSKEDLDRAEADLNEQTRKTGAVEATEIFFLPLSNYSQDTPYGKPRWIGNLLSVLGSREAEEVNFLYFQNKSVPPMAIMIMGGRLGSSSAKRIEDFVENNLRGKRNFHKILIIEAIPFGKDESQGVQHSGKARIEMKPLTDAQLNDALFQNYDEKNRDKIGESFRLPRLLRGDIRDFNRSTALASLAFAESQVFQPERDLFDSEMNRKILADMEIKYWEFASMGPITKDSEALSQIIERLSKAAVITPEEARTFAEDVFNKPLEKLDEPWVKQPLSLTLAGLGLQMSGNEEMGTLPGQDNRLKEIQDDKARALANKGDLGTSDFNAGGLKQPAQGCEPGEHSFGTCPPDKKNGKGRKEQIAGLLGVPVDKIDETETDEGTVMTITVPQGALQELIEHD